MEALVPSPRRLSKPSTVPATQGSDTSGQTPSPQRPGSSTAVFDMAFFDTPSAKEDLKIGKSENTNGPATVPQEEHRVSTEHEPQRFSTTTIGRRQAEWERQLDLVDHEQSDLFALHGRLARDQMRTFTTEVAQVQRKMQDLDSDSRRFMGEVQRLFRDAERKQVEERDHRQALASNLEKRMDQLRAELEMEGRRRSSGDAELIPKLEDISSSLAARTKDHKALINDMAGLREHCNAVASQNEHILQNISQEMKERKSAEEAMMSNFHELHDLVRQESQARSRADEGLAQATAKGLEQERRERSDMFANLQAAIAKIEREVGALRDEMPLFGTRLQELQEGWSSKLMDTQHVLEKEITGIQASLTKLDRNGVDLSRHIKEETAARAALGEEVEQLLKAQRVKFKTLIAEQGDSMKKSVEDFKQQAQEQLDAEGAARQAEHEAAQVQIDAHRASLESGMHDLHRRIADTEARLREEHASTARDLGDNLARLGEQQVHHAREFRETLHGRLGEERSTRELKQTDHDGRLQYFETFLQDARELFVHMKPRFKPNNSKDKMRSPLTSPRLSSPRVAGADAHGKVHTEKPETAPHLLQNQPKLISSQLVSPRMHSVEMHQQKTEASPPLPSPRAQHFESHPRKSEQLNRLLSPRAENVDARSGTPNKTPREMIPRLELSSNKQGLEACSRKPALELEQRWHELVQKGLTGHLQQHKGSGPNPAVQTQSAETTLSQ